MADYFTSFSCILDVGSGENAAHATTILDAFTDELLEREEIVPGFEMEPDPTHAPGALWLHSGDYGEPEHVIAFVLRCAEAFDLQGRWGFVWSLTCSKPRLDGFGGGAQVVDLAARKSIDWIDCDHWLAAVLDEGEHPDPVPDSI